MDYFVVGYFIVDFCLVLDWEDERINYIASCKGDEVELFTVFLLFIDASTNHDSGAEEGSGMMFEADPAASSKPFTSFEAVDEEIGVESFSLFPFKADSPNNN